MLDPKLQEAEKVIKEVLNSYAIAGLVVLVSKNAQHQFVEYPKWSIFKSVENGVSMRFDPKAYVTEAEQDEALEGSANVLLNFQSLLGDLFHNLHAIETSFKKQVDIHVNKAKGG